MYVSCDCEKEACCMHPDHLPVVSIYAESREDTIEQVKVVEDADGRAIAVWRATTD